MESKGMFEEGWDLEEYLGFIGTMMLESKLHPEVPNYYGLVLSYDSNQDYWTAKYSDVYCGTGKTVREALEAMWKTCLGHVFTIG